MAGDYAIETRDLTMRYGRVDALRSLNLRVQRQHVTGFLGRNGAGKSTTLRILLGITRPLEGTATVLGRNATDPRESCEIRSRVAYVGENKELLNYLTVDEQIRFAASFCPDMQVGLIEKLKRQYELPSKRKVKDLSKGMRAKLALLLALARRPELLILDEPSEGLDPVSIEELLGTVGAVGAEGTTVFFSSHQIAEVERIADSVCIIDHGRLVAELSLDEMRQDYRRITLGFARAPQACQFDIAGIHQIRSDGRQIVVWAKENSAAIVEHARSLEALSIDVAPVSLRELFLETVREVPVMLFYKAWRESRTTFLLGVLLLFLFCTGEILLRQYARVQGIGAAYHAYVTAQIFSGTSKILFVLPVILLGPAGLLRERTNSRAIFVLSLPIRRMQFLVAELTVGLVEVAGLALLPAILIQPLSMLVHQSYPITEALRFSFLRLVCGSEIFALAFVLSTFVRGTYTVPIACYVALLVQVRAANWHPLTYGLNPLRTMDWGRSLDDLIQPFPWEALGLLTLIAVSFFAIAALITERQNI